MKRSSLICGALIATVITLISVGGSLAHPPTPVILAPSYAQATFAVPPQPNSPDVILALSDMVDLERIIKATSPEERERFKIHTSRPADHDTLS